MTTIWSFNDLKPKSDIFELVVDGDFQVVSFIKNKRDVNDFPYEELHFKGVESAICAHYHFYPVKIRMSNGLGKYSLDARNSLYLQCRLRFCFEHGEAG